MIRLFVSDVDGTLLNENGQLEEGTIEAIRRFQREDGIFMVATGRNPWELDEILSQIDDVVLNCVNGAVLCKKDGEVLIGNYVDERYVRLIEGYCRDKGIPVEYHGEEKTYTTCDRESFKKRAISTFGRRYSDPEKIFDKIYDVKQMRFGMRYEEIPCDKIFKIEALFMNEEERIFLNKRVKEEFRDCNIVSVEAMGNIEITSALSGKARAIERFCELEGIDEAEVAVAGDSGNDIGMLKRYANSYAMANGDEETKKAARYLALSNREHGIEILINKICDENES